LFPAAGVASASTATACDVPVDLTVGPPPRPETQAEPGDSAGDAPSFAEPVDAELVPPVDEAVVRNLLKGLGWSANVVLADDDVPEQWKFTDSELDGLTPPLTRIINRRPKWRAAVARGDEAVVVMILAGYGGRNVEAGRKARKERDEQSGEDGGAAFDDRAADRGAHQGFAGGNGGGGGFHTATDRVVR
jgi:hypothetical protein